MYPESILSTINAKISSSQQSQSSSLRHIPVNEMYPDSSNSSYTSPTLSEKSITSSQICQEPDKKKSPTATPIIPSSSIDQIPSMYY